MRQLNVNLHALQPAEQKRLFKSRESVYPASFFLKLCAVVNLKKIKKKQTYIECTLWCSIE